MGWVGKCLPRSQIQDSFTVKEENNIINTGATFRYAINSSR